MRITAIVCGRRDGFSERLGRIALKAAKDQGAEVALVNLMDCKIEPCINCGACVRAMRDENFNGKCPLYKDDMAWLDEQMLASDGLLFVAPMYENAAPGSYKVFCDRIGPSHDITFLRQAYEDRMRLGKAPKIDTRFFRNRPVAFIGHGGSEWSYLSFPSLAVPAIPLGMTIVDYIQLDWNNPLMMEEDRLDRVRRCGGHLAQMAALQPGGQMTYIGKEGACPACHCDVVRVDEVGRTACALCGVVGRLEGRRVAVQPEDVALSHVFEAGRQVHMADLKNNAKVRAGLDQDAIRKKTKPLLEEIPVCRPQRDRA